MAPTDLTAAHDAHRAASGWRTFAVMLIALSATTLLAAGLGELPSRIGPHLILHPHSTPSVRDAVMTWLHNVRIAGWPLLLAALGLHRARWQRRLGDTLLAVSLATNAALVGAALAAGEQRMLPYLPHLPLEWAAFALGATGWHLATRDRLTRRHLAAVSGAFLVLLGLAAALETYTVPHL